MYTLCIFIEPLWKALWHYQEKVHNVQPTVLLLTLNPLKGLAYTTLRNCHTWLPGKRNTEKSIYNRIVCNFKEMK